MATSAVSFGALVTLEELVPSSPQFTQGASLRVTGKLQEYDIETAIASIVEGNASLKIDTQHLKVNLHIGSLYQFIGELLIDPSNQDENMVLPEVYSMVNTAIPSITLELTIMFKNCKHH
ncbi:CST complex subunit TEN1 isoform X2 [Coffea eugenioides]|uniref:CST complex subunit TEN1 isoform X2 n=1 Tax=Coffea eugenioides TaxID=49369 RepID=UPI000F60FD41|nr:CST complex subunit TEN1 isoform X2 [Coffea eugenioides]